MCVKNKIAGLLTAIVFIASVNICAFDAKSKNTVNSVSLRGQSMLPPTEASSGGRSSFSKPVSVQLHEESDMTAQLPVQHSYVYYGRDVKYFCPGEIRQYIFGSLKSEIMRRAP